MVSMLSRVGFPFFSHFSFLARMRESGPISREKCEKSEKCENSLKCRELWTLHFFAFTTMCFFSRNKCLHCTKSGTQQINQKIHNFHYHVLQLLYVYYCSILNQKSLQKHWFIQCTGFIEAVATVLPRNICNEPWFSCNLKIIMHGPTQGMHACMSIQGVSEFTDF